MHSSDTCKSAKTLSLKADLSSNMTIFLNYTPVGHNPSVFKPRKNTKSKGQKGSKKLAHLDPNPNDLPACIAYVFGHASGMFFRKKQIQCLEKITP